MIYVGTINFGALNKIEENLPSSIETFIEGQSTLTKKGCLTICCGKISQEQDLDTVLENNHSLLIGQVFDKENSSSLESDQFHALGYLEKNFILEKLWGKYVCLQSDNYHDEFEVILDSTGQLPFFYRRFSDGSLLFSSNIEFIYRSLFEKPSFNWNYLCSYLIYSDSSSIETPFENIYELPPACKLNITKNSLKTFPFWDPVHSSLQPSQKNAVEILNSTLKPLIKPYKNICISLSGGLDSSSLTYCLKSLAENNQNLIAFNYFHSQIKSSNELFHARKVCQDTQIELVEIDASDSLPFDPPKREILLKANKPFPGLTSLRWVEVIENHVSSLKGSSIFMSGHGSDHIFMRPPSKKAAADYFIEKGLKGFKNELKEVTHFYRDSFSFLLKENIKDITSFYFGKDREKRSLQTVSKNLPPWINPLVFHNISFDHMHPIYHYLPKEILPGKYDQIDALYEGLASIHIEVLNQANPTCYPFLCQPVVEFALSFPTYNLFKEGYDRYPLRSAIDEAFKAEVAWRQDKSQTTGLFQLGVKRNISDILDLCLEGEFVKQGFIHKERLYEEIKLISNGSTQHMWPFTHLVSAEIFLKSWGHLS